MALSIKNCYMENAKEAVFLEERVINQVCKAILATIANGLPEEAHTAEVCRHILHETEKMLDTRLITLE